MRRVQIRKQHLKRFGFNSCFQKMFTTIDVYYWHGSLFDEVFSVEFLHPSVERVNPCAENTRILSPMQIQVESNIIYKSISGSIIFFKPLGVKVLFPLSTSVHLT